jgi:carbonic anhydrase
MYFSSFNIIFLLTIIHQSIASGWNYGQEGPDVWSDDYPACAGNAQSPINIRTACTAYKLFSPFKFSAAYSATHNFKFINNGHSIAGTYTGSDSSIFELTGGGLDGTYIFSSFHLHWGENYKSGSEHQV